MVYLKINKKNYNNGNPSLIENLNNYLETKDCKVFILFYMEGCGPCNATRPEWSKLKNVLPDNILNNDKIAIASIDQELIGSLKNIKSEPSGFPTMRLITNNGDKVENYEDSNVLKKDRTIDSFVEWIENNTKNEKTLYNSKNKKQKNNTNKKNNLYGGNNRTKKIRKWSLKYKRRINCRKPKGFSQRQYCKYSRKK